MTSALYVPSKKLIYVLLGGWTRPRLRWTGFSACATSKPSIIAIDLATDKVVPLGGTAPGGGIALEGYSPALGNQLVYDAARDACCVLNVGMQRRHRRRRRGRRHAAVRWTRPTSPRKQSKTCST